LSRGYNQIQYMQSTIHPFQESDKKACLDIIYGVVVDGFIETGIDIQKEKDHLSEELAIQETRINQYFSNYFVIKKEKKVIGMVAYLEPCEAVYIALKELKISPISIREVISLYVDPAYQRQGVGSQLFSKIISEIKKLNIEYFAISTGYKKGRNFWTKKLGQESIVLPTYYSGWPCSVWIKKVNDVT
jgi:GNAT superfamily N-acetyltransferase